MLWWTGVEERHRHAALLQGKGGAESDDPTAHDHDRLHHVPFSSNASGFSMVPALLALWPHTASQAQHKPINYVTGPRPVSPR
jgi:hypothetical protein